mmetsp:Transcript_160410/g.514834  ORF Transcript_160410/g.514834 Transcript_160410/m.514834 type:complete len:335 (+) Transcript_160410:1121-2125(+)
MGVLFVLCPEGRDQVERLHTRGRGDGRRPRRGRGRLRCGGFGACGSFRAGRRSGRGHAPSSLHLMHNEGLVVGVYVAIARPIFAVGDRRVGQGHVAFVVDVAQLGLLVVGVALAHSGLFVHLQVIPVHLVDRAVGKLLLQPHELATDQAIPRGVDLLLVSLRVALANARAHDLLLQPHAHDGTLRTHRSDGRRRLGRRRRWARRQSGNNDRCAGIRLREGQLRRANTEVVQRAHPTEEVGVMACARDQRDDDGGPAPRALATQANLEVQAHPSGVVWLCVHSETRQLAIARSADAQAHLLSRRNRRAPLVGLLQGCEFEVLAAEEALVVDAFDP